MKKDNVKHDVEGFLTQNDIPHTTATSGELIVFTCPVCGSTKKKFYINSETGLFDCKICGARGNFFKFKSLYGVVGEAGKMSVSNATPMDSQVAEDQHNALWYVPGAVEYLHSRGFTDKTISDFKLGFMTDSGGDWIGIPHYQDGKLWNIKYRRFAGGDKTFKRVTGQPSILYNTDNVSYKKKALVVVEGEMDCIAATQMGVKNVVAITGGAQTFIPEWKLFFNKFETIYVVYDSDKSGQEGARKIAEKIGIKKVKNLVLPTKDANEYLTSPEYNPGDFKLEFNRAVRPQVDNVSNAEDITSNWDEWFSGKDNHLKGLSTGFERLDGLTGGLKAGDLIIFSGDSGIGKTTCLNNVVSHVLNNGHPTFGFYLEGQIQYMFSRMVGASEGIEYALLNKDPEKFAELKDRVSKLPLYFYSGSQGGIDIAYLKEFIPVVVDLYGIELIVIDNLQKVVRGADNNYTQKLSEAVSTLKDLAVDCKIPIVLIAHIRKRESANTIITKYDAKSSSSIYQDADIYLILQKIKNEMYLTLEKNRMGEDGLHIPLNVDYRLGQFRERPDTPHQPAANDGPKPENNVSVTEIGF